MFGVVIVLAGMDVLNVEEKISRQAVRE